MLSTLRIQNALLGVALALGVPMGQQVTQPTFRAGADLVTIDVAVLTRGGDPVSNLSAQDFIVTVDGSPRRIRTHQLIRFVPGSTPVPDATAPPSGRLFVLVVDRGHIPAGEGLDMLAAAGQFIDALPAADRVAVWSVPSGASSLRISADREAAKRSLNSMVGTYRPPVTKYGIGRGEAIAVEEGRRDDLNALVARECEATGESARADTLARCRSQVETEARTLARDWQQRAAATLSDIRQLTHGLRAVDGPKHLVFITTGPVQTNDTIGTLASLGADAADARVTIHALQVHDAGPRASQGLRPTAGNPDVTPSAASALAGATGGLAITPAAASTGFSRLLHELSASYLLAVEVEASDRDGRVHAIDVRLRGGQRGVEVRARKAFRIEQGLAAPPSVTASPEERRPPSATPPPRPATPDIGTGRLVEVISSYAGEFEREFAAVVVEERYVQTIHPWRGLPKGPEAEPALKWFDDKDAKVPTSRGPITARRQILSDLLLVQVAGSQWVGYRDVAAVDFREVRNREERVRALFLSQSPDRDAQLRRVTDESARYNLGETRRTFNLPTVALSFLRKADIWRFKFKLEKDDRVGDRACHVLSFNESARPTLIGTSGRGADIPIYGRVWVDAESGVVRRTEMRCDPSPLLRLLVRVDFVPAPGLSVLVPLSMWEWYELSQPMSDAKPGGKWGDGRNPMGISGGGWRMIECLATYSNFRRFEVTTSEQIK